MNFELPRAEPPVGEWVAVGACRVDLRTGVVRAPAGDLRLSRKATLVLAELLARPGVTVSRDELLQAAWGPHPPGDDVLSHAVKEIRRALGDNPKLPGLIETIPKSGYRFLSAPQGVDPPDAVHAAPPAAVAEAPRDARRVPLRVAGFALACAAVAALAWLFAMRREASAPAVIVGEQRVLTFDERIERFPRLSPDGKYLAYSAIEKQSGRERIFVRSVGGDSEIVLAGNASADGYDEIWPVWFNDGTQIAFQRRFDADRCSIVATGALGGAERVLTPCPTFIRERFDFLDPTTLLRSMRKGGPKDEARIYRLDISQARHRVIDIPYAGAAGMHDFDPRLSPDGERIAFVRGYPAGSLLLVPAAGGELRSVTPTPVFMRGHDWMGDSRHLVVSADFGPGNRLYVVDSETGRWTDTGIDDAEAPTAAHEGDLVAYTRRSYRLAMQRLPLDDAALPPVPFAPSTGSNSSFAYGPSGDTFAFASNRSGAWMVWYVGPAGGEPVPVTRPRQQPIGDIVFTHDGGRLYFTEYATDQSTTWSVLPDRGASTETAVAQGSRAALPVDGGLIATVVRDGRQSLAELGPDGAVVRVIDGAPSASIPQLDDRGRILHARANEDGLYAYSPATGLDEPFSPVPSMFFSLAWAWRNGVLWYFAEADGRIVLMRWSSQGGAQAVRTLPPQTHGGLLAVDAAGRYATIARIEHEESDLATVRITLGEEASTQQNQ